MTTKELDYGSGAAHVNGEIVPLGEAKISLLDWGFLHSDATYDVAHVWQGSFFRLDDHIERFHAGMAKLQMSIPYNREALKTILNDCVAATSLQNAYVEMICTRGMPEPGSRDPRSCTNQFFAFAIPFVWISNPETSDGLHLIISQQQRIPPASIDPTIKNYHWLDMVKGQFEAYERGGENAVLIDAGGNLVEGPGFNLFVVKDEQLTTPAKGALEGITRQTVIDIATRHGYRVEQGTLTAQQALEADEVFVTSTAGGVMPVIRIDDQIITDGKIGSVTAKLRELYWNMHDQADYRLDIDYYSPTLF